MVKLYKFIKKIQSGYSSVDKRAIKIAITVALLFGAVWIIYGWHLNDFTEAYRSVMRDYILAQTAEESQGISNEFNAKVEIISYGRGSIERAGLSNDGKDVAMIMTKIEEAGGFENVVFIDTDGVIHYSDASISRDPIAGDIVSLCGDGSGLTVFHNKEKYFSSYGGFGIVAPVLREGTVIGYLCGVASYKSLVKDDEIRSDLHHDEIIVDPKGKIVAKIYYNDEVKILDADTNFFEATRDVTTQDEYNRFTDEYEERINADVFGRSIISTENGRISFFYYPIEHSNGWVVINCYPESIIIEKTRSIQMKAIAMFAIIVIIMALAAMLIIRYLGAEHKRVTELKFLDGLTGVYNRSAFVSNSEKILKENKNLPYNMLCLDVINFRIINETYGHERSDVIIKATAEACKEAFGHNESYGRLSADVFVALMLDDGEEEERIGFIEKKVAEEARKVFINHPIKFKRGRYEIVNNGESINGMIDKANVARKYVDCSKPPYVGVYSEDLMNQARKTEEIESKMFKALEGGEFRPYLQGKFDIESNSVVGAEALVRWIKPDGTIVPPGDFIPLFEQNGFVEKIDFFMLEEICKYIRKMIDEGRKVYKISVNQSRYLMNDPEYVSRVKEVLLRYQIPVGLIELELTETVFFHEKERMISMMNDLKHINVSLSIDDFGSGYSSFNILKDVPFDVLKIDREFLTDSVHTEKGKWILEKIVDMAHGLGMGVICEGVETNEHVDLLKSIGCHYAQGFLYARPIPMDEFIEKYNGYKND